MPFSDILAYCLMPNHYHLLLKTNELSTEKFTSPTKKYVQKLSQGLGTLTSSYTQALNVQLNRKGNLFAHRTQAKMLNDAKNDYLLSCFLYIHQNPIQAGLVDKLDDWEFSSYLDYIGKRKGTLVNIEETLGMLNIEASQIEYITNYCIQDKDDEFFM